MGLEAFLALAVPEEQLVGCARADLADLLCFSTAMRGVFDDRGGLSLAHLGQQEHPANRGVRPPWCGTDLESPG